MAEARFTSAPLIMEDPVTGARKSIGVVVLVAATYEVLEYKVFHADQVPGEWRKVLLNE